VLLHRYLDAANITQPKTIIGTSPKIGLCSKTLGKGLRFRF
jgi:hypothetical protein